MHKIIITQASYQFSVEPRFPFVYQAEQVVSSCCLFVIGSHSQGWNVIIDIRCNGKSSTSFDVNSSPSEQLLEVS